MSTGGNLFGTRKTWSLMLGIVIIFTIWSSASSCSSPSSSSTSSLTKTGPEYRYADAIDSQNVQNACTKLMGVYAVNKYSATSARVSYEGEVRITHTKWDSGFAVDLTVHYTNKDGLSGSVPLYCSTKADYSRPSFSPRSV